MAPAQDLQTSEKSPDGLHVLPLAYAPQAQGRGSATPGAPRRLRLRAAAASVALVVCTIFYVLVPALVPGAYDFNHGLTLGEGGIPTHIERQWAMYTPWHAVGQYPAAPRGCRVNQVNLLQRHGARQPSGDDGDAYRKSVKKLLKVKKHIPAHSPLAFLKNYTYVLTQDELVPFGAEQSRLTGAIDYNRYMDLVLPEHVPYVRASGKQRVVDSSKNWTVGFAHASGHRVDPILSLVLLESKNDTLDIEMCPNAGDGSKHTTMWLSEFAPPLTARLRAAALPATPHITNADVYHYMSVCALETLFLRAPSPWCALFADADFAAFEYFGDLEKFYRTGYGAPLGRVQGVGYVNELLARLTGTPVRDHTQTNRTLDAAPATFPLDRTFYADFTHENLMIAVYAALGLYREAAPLDPRVPDPERIWLASRLVPFSARMVTERLVCGDEGEEYVRVLINDLLHPLACAEGREDGLCKLDAFVESQTYARSDGAGDFPKCFAEHHDR